MLHTAQMVTVTPYDGAQSFLRPPALKDRLPADDLAHSVVAAVERLPLAGFPVKPQTGGTPQYQPRLMLALLVYCDANGRFSSRRIERATHRDLGVRCVAAKLHPDHDTFAVFRRANKAAFEAAVLQLLLLALDCGRLRLGTVLIDGTKIDANASKIRSVRYDRAQVLRAELAADIAALAAQAEAADAAAIPDPQARPAEMARARRCRPSSTPHAPGWRPRRARQPPPPGWTTMPGRPPGTPRPGNAARRRSRPRTPRQRSGRATWWRARPMRQASPQRSPARRRPSACRPWSWPIPASPAARP